MLSEKSLLRVETDNLQWAVELKKVLRRFGNRTVLDGIDLSLRPAEFVAILGRSGTGKTTLLRILAGLDSADGGAVKLDQARSVVFQEPRLVPARRVWENVVLGERTPTARQAAERTLAEVGLSRHVDAWPKTLSGGEAQRVALARALVREPRLLLLDEPFASLDALTRIKMHALVRQLCRRHQPAVVLVTHDVDEAILLADRVLVLSRGQVTLDLRVDLGAERSKTSPVFDSLRKRLLRELGVDDAEGYTVDAERAGDDVPVIRPPVSRRRFMATAATAATAGIAMVGGFSIAAQARKRPKLVVGVQTIALRETVLASKVLDGLPFDVEWAVLPGPAAQLAALYAKSIDVGLTGSTSLIFEQAKPEWDEKRPPLQVVAIWQNPSPNYPSIVTAVRKSAGVKTLDDLRGKRWGHNYGGFNYGQYVATLVKAGLTEKDIQPVRFTEAFASGAAFNRGQVDVFSGDPTAIFDALQTAEAEVRIDNQATGVPGHSIFIARSEVIADDSKNKLLFEFLARVRQHWGWYEKNVPSVERMFLKTLQLTPDRARFFARHTQAKFYPIDARFQRDLQWIADLYYQFKAIPKPVRVASHLSRAFNGATVGSE